MNYGTVPIPITFSDFLSLIRNYLFPYPIPFLSSISCFWNPPSPSDRSLVVLQRILLNNSCFMSSNLGSFVIVFLSQGETQNSCFRCHFSNLTGFQIDLNLLRVCSSPLEFLFQERASSFWILSILMKELICSCQMKVEIWYGISSSFIHFFLEN